MRATNKYSVSDFHIKFFNWEGYMAEAYSLRSYNTEHRVLWVEMHYGNVESSLDQLIYTVMRVYIVKPGYLERADEFAGRMLVFGRINLFVSNMWFVRCARFMRPVMSLHTQTLSRCCTEIPRCGANISMYKLRKMKIHSSKDNFKGRAKSIHLNT